MIVDKSKTKIRQKQIHREPDEGSNHDCSFVCFSDSSVGCSDGGGISNSEMKQWASHEKPVVGQSQTRGVTVK
jgi:hypothetical protein